MNLFLIGYRCTGKTTVGKALADRLDWSFLDTDQMIAETSGSSIAWMIGEKGWSFFREQERQVMQTVAARDGQVVATGGGIVLDARNVLAMQHSGKVVWLTASRKTIAARMLADDTTAGNRPSLTSQGQISEITAVLSERIPLYAKASDFVINTDRETVNAICDRIVRRLSIN